MASVRARAVKMVMDMVDMPNIPLYTSERMHLPLLSIGFENKVYSLCAKEKG